MDDMVQNDRAVIAAPPPVERRTSARGALWLFLAFLTGLGAMALGLYTYAKWFLPGPIPNAAVPLGTTADGKQTPVVIVPGPAPPPAIDLGALSGRATELAARLSDLESRTAMVNSDAQNAAANATRAEGMLIAFAARRAIDRGLGLGYVEEQLRVRFGTTQARAIATIVQAAREPVTLEDLRVGLDGIAGELATGASMGWWPSFRREIGNLVVLHRAGTPSPLPVDRLARARRLLEAGQVEAALAEVARMPGATRATRWTGAARRYIGARQALDAIEAAAIQGQGAPVR